MSIRTALTPLLLAFGASLLSAGVTQAASLEVTVSGLTGDQGQLFVALYDDPAVWLKGKPLRAQSVKVEGTTLTLRFDDLPEGATVALSLVQDLNGNGRLDFNAMRMPSEPYGFSNNAQGHFGPPSFDAAKLVVSGATKAQLSL